MRKALVVLVILALAVWIRDNNTHYILKGLVAAWPIQLLLAIWVFFIWQGIGAKSGVDLKIRHPDD
ncbi:MAG: hypothetical protein HKN18_16585 [Silicimonas sp.]|nr:hypothetical protein [Silicimonas sp.]